MTSGINRFNLRFHAGFTVTGKRRLASGANEGVGDVGGGMGKNGGVGVGVDGNGTKTTGVGMVCCCET
jgi:hypothetical protein